MARHLVPALFGLILTACAAAHTVERLSGALIGRIDPALDETDQQLAFAAAEAALDAGQPQEWTNPESGHRGRFSPGAEEVSATDGTCRSFRHRIWTEGLPYTIEGTACRKDGGPWQVVSG